MPSDPKISPSDDARVSRPAEPRTPIAVESWENEGGHFPSLPGLATVPSNVSSPVPDQASESPELAAMRAKFVADFTGGTMGQHHNTYQHRSRVLSRLAAERPR